MPWQDNSGNRGPWGQPPRGENGSGRNDGGRGSGEPPDLEDLLEASRRRLRRAFPRGRGNGGGGGGRGGGIPFSPQLFGLIAAAVLGLWLFSGVYQVNPGERALVTTFGKFTSIQARV